MEVVISRDQTHTHRIYEYKSSKLAQLDESQKKLVLKTLSPCCVGCVSRGLLCTTMDSVDDQMNLIDKNSQPVTTEWCKASGIPINID